MFTFNNESIKYPLPSSCQRVVIIGSPFGGNSKSLQLKRIQEREISISGVWEIHGGNCSRKIVSFTNCKLWSLSYPILNQKKFVLAWCQRMRMRIVSSCHYSELNYTLAWPTPKLNYEWMKEALAFSSCSLYAHNKWAVNMLQNVWKGFGIINYWEYWN